MRETLSFLLRPSPAPRPPVSGPPLCSQSGAGAQNPAEHLLLWVTERLPRPQRGTCSRLSFPSPGGCEGTTQAAALRMPHSGGGAGGASRAGRWRRGSPGSVHQHSSQAPRHTQSGAGPTGSEGSGACDAQSDPAQRLPRQRPWTPAGLGARVHRGRPGLPSEPGGPMSRSEGESLQGACAEPQSANTT